MGYRNEWKPYVRTYHADDIAISYPYLFASTTRNDLVDLEPTKSWLDAHLFEPNAWKEGNDPLRNILWWWCDALFMAPPVIAYYAQQTGEMEYLDAMHKYFSNPMTFFLINEESLFARDVRFKITGSENDRWKKMEKKYSGRVATDGCWVVWPYS
jgi:unsaturated rhamnogalacturonyl hydrolase